MPDSTMSNRPIVFGEALLDVFPDGTEVLGGAPFNVAWHLHGFGLRPLMISRVGNDPRGRTVLSKMTDWGMDTSGIQIDTDHPTGIVEVSLNKGEPDFDIVPERAYDFIQWGPIDDLLRSNRGALLYHGTLIGRSPASEQSLYRMIRETKAPVFLDVNLRKRCWERSRVKGMLQSATWIKLNEAELMELQSGIEPEAEAVKAMLIAYHSDSVIVTRGERGATLYALDDGPISERPPASEEIVDTVGAGDAFSAVMILGLLSSWNPHRALACAVSFAAAVCRIRGAIVDDPALYEGFNKKWERS